MFWSQQKRAPRKQRLHIGRLRHEIYMAHGHDIYSFTNVQYMIYRYIMHIVSMLNTYGTSMAIEYDKHIHVYTHQYKH